MDIQNALREEIDELTVEITGLSAKLSLGLTTEEQARLSRLVIRRNLANARLSKLSGELEPTWSRREIMKGNLLRAGNAGLHFLEGLGASASMWGIPASFPRQASPGSST